MLHFFEEPTSLFLTIALEIRDHFALPFLSPQTYLWLVFVSKVFR